MASLEDLQKENARLRASLEARQSVRPSRPVQRQSYAPVTAVGRSGEVLSRSRVTDSINPHELPVEFVEEARADGFELEWKRYNVYGMDQPSYIAGMLANGWRPVCASRLPGYFSNESEGAIIYEGQILMERPTELCEEARRDEARKAAAQVQVKHQSWGVESRDESVFATQTPNIKNDTYLNVRRERAPADLQPSLAIDDGDVA